MILEFPDNISDEYFSKNMDIKYVIRNSDKITGE
jgi:hypothetical protein